MAVMLMGALLCGVPYSLREYLCTFLVAGGVAVFALQINTSILLVSILMYNLVFHTDTFKE